MATTTFYPDPSPESTSVDGSVRSPTSTSWNTAHDATTGSFNDSATTLEICSKGQDSPSRYVIRRGVFLFDTSAIAGDNIDSATFGLYVTAKTNSDNDGDDFLVLVNSNPASNTALANEDFDLVGDAIDNPTEGSDRIDIGSLSTSAYNTFTLDADGLGYIDGSGVTKLGMREGHDVLDNQYAGSFCAPWGCGNIVTASSAEAAGTSQDPKLVIEHSPAASGNMFLMF
jgi:hypothetical protein